MFVRAGQPRGGGLDEGQVMIAVGDAGVMQVRACSQREAFGGVVADRLKEPVAGRPMEHLGLDQTLADQRGQQVKHLPFRDVAVAGDRFAHPGSSLRRRRRAVEHDLLSELSRS